MQDYYSPSTVLPGLNSEGEGTRGQAQTVSWSLENTIDYRRRFGSLHDVDLLAGTTLQRSNTAAISGSSMTFRTDALGVNGLNAAQTFVSVWTGAPHSSLASYFGRARWGIADKYLFTVTGRVDGSSRFGAGHQYGFFPSAAFAWRASEEPFVKRLGLFDDLKVRASYGRTGNQEIGNYNALARLGNTVYVFGGNRAIGFAPGSLANPDLRWETTDGVDVGIDATLLRGRVTVGADYYYKKTHDMLYTVPIPSSSGFSYSLQNIGSLQNRGFELSVSTVNVSGALGRGGYEGIQDDGDGNIWIVEDIGGSNKPGTVVPSATRDEPLRVCSRNRRRVNMVVSLGILRFEVVRRTCLQARPESGRAWRPVLRH